MSLLKLSLDIPDHTTVTELFLHALYRELLIKICVRVNTADKSCFRYANKIEDNPDLQVLLSTITEHTDSHFLVKRDLNVKDHFYEIMVENRSTKSNVLQQSAFAYTL